MADQTRLSKLIGLLTSRRKHKNSRYVRDSDPTLLKHLEIVGALELSGFLFWVEPKRLKRFQFHTKGGFAIVFTARVSWEFGFCCRPSANYALKELNLAELTIVLHTIVPATQLVMNLIMDDALLPIYGLTQHPVTGDYLMMMALAKGGTLESQRSNPICSWESIAEQAKGLAECLAKIHKQGFIHNDIHPGNVVYLWRNHPCLIDIGLGSFVGEVGEPVGWGRGDYLPPEIREGGPEARVQASDVYCFATLIWQMITGVPPRGDSSRAVIKNPGHLREELIPGTPDILQSVLIRSWNPDPAQRPTMESVHNDLYKWWCSIRSEGMKEVYQNRNKTLFLPNTLWYIAQRQAAYQKEKDKNTSNSSFNFTSGSSSTLKSSASGIGERRSGHRLYSTDGSFGNPIALSRR